MRAFLDQDGCIACGKCYNICPGVFESGKSGIAHICSRQVSKAQENLALSAKFSCPTSVISISDPQ